MDKEQLLADLENSERVLVGLGEEWNGADYKKLAKILEGKDYFIVTTSTDGKILNSELNLERIVAPCGNETWKQCSNACTKDIWEAHEVETGICPHCKSPLVGNTIHAETYIEEGYLIQWKEYMQWLSRTLNKKLLILELGVGFQTPTVIRWPFEKTAFFNNQAKIYRAHETFSQLSEELIEKGVSIKENSVKMIENL